jgi:hypothetical protein
MVLLFLVIVISLVLSNIPFLVSDHKASMVKLEGMTLGASPSLSPSPSHSPSPYPSPTMKSLSPSIASDIMPAKY